MVSIDNAIVARYSHSGHTFEILVDPKLAADLKDGKEVSVDDLMATQEVFKDAAKGEKASDHVIEDVLKTNDMMEIARKIITEGEVNLTTEQRREMVDKKRKQIIAFIAREAIDPTTKTPHPPARIEAAMEEARVKIEPFRSVEDQVDKVVKALRPLLPISIERIRLQVNIPPLYTGAAYGHVKQYNMKEEQWLNNGTLKCVIEIPAGLESQLYDEINGLTKGEAIITRL